MSSNDVRSVIDCFCQILSFYGFSTINTEVFYSAKSDRNDATSTLWRLIYEILHANQHEFLDGQFDQIPRNQIVRSIKANLFERGYTYEQFSLLDEQMKTGSRQLLICLGWLIDHVKLIDKCIRYYLDSISKSEQTDEKQSVKYDLNKRVEEVAHSNRKITSRLRDINEGNLRDIAQLSDFERQLCRNPHLISQYLTELDDEYQKLNIFLTWNKHESIFWKWMENVLDQPNSSEIINVDTQHLQMEKVKFNEALDNLDEVLIRLKELWLTHDDRTSIENDLVSMIASIDNQISFLFNQLLNNSK